MTPKRRKNVDTATWLLKWIGVIGAMLTLWIQMQGIQRQNRELAGSVASSVSDATKLAGRLGRLESRVGKLERKDVAKLGTRSSVAPADSIRSQSILASIGGGIANGVRSFWHAIGGG